MARETEGRQLSVAGVVARSSGPIEPSWKTLCALDLGAEVVVIAPEVSDDVRGWADQGRCEVHVKTFTPPDLDGAWLALTATDDPETNEAVHAAAEERRIWVNSADDPANCSFTLMSVVRRSDLVVAIGTGGVRTGRPDRCNGNRRVHLRRRR